MNKTNFKLFTMFLAGIAFSAMTVLAATISISTNFEDGVTQYLKKLVILKNDNTTGMVLDGDTLSGEDIYGTNIYGTNITGTNIKGTNITGNKIYGQSGLFSQYCDDDGDNCSSIEDLKLWSKNNEDIYYTSGNVGIGDTNPTEKLVVEGSIKTSKVKNNNNSYIELFQNKLDFVSNELVFKSPNGTQEEKVTIKGGKVGIGTNNSSEKLEVNGTGKFSGNISAKTGYFTDINVKKGYFSGIIIKGDANDTELKIGDNIHLSEAGIGGLIKFKGFLAFRSGMDEIMRINNQGNLVHQKNIIANGNISAKNGYFSGVYLTTTSNSGGCESDADFGKIGLVRKYSDNKKTKYDLSICGEDLIQLGNHCALTPTRIPITEIIDYAGSIPNGAPCDQHKD